MYINALQYQVMSDNNVGKYHAVCLSRIVQVEICIFCDDCYWLI